MFKVAQYSFLAREEWVRNGASARVFKERKNKNKHGGATFIASGVSLTAIVCDPNKCSTKNRKKSAYM